MIRPVVYPPVSFFSARIGHTSFFLDDTSSRSGATLDQPGSMEFERSFARNAPGSCSCISGQDRPGAFCSHACVRREEWNAPENCSHVLRNGFRFLSPDCRTMTSCGPDEADRMSTGMKTIGYLRKKRGPVFSGPIAALTAGEVRTGPAGSGNYPR